MKDEGFNLDIKVDWETGMIFGGNQFNCGHLDGQDGRERARRLQGDSRHPARRLRRRDMRLLYSCLKWARGSQRERRLPLHGRQEGRWFRHLLCRLGRYHPGQLRAMLLCPTRRVEDKTYDVNPKVVNRRGIYKDLYRSGKEYEDYQLRPNFPIAMTVAPDLFDPEHGMHALCVADAVLRGPIGMATLDPADLNYRPYYINSEG